MSELERRYRRLLALYPRDHREQHGEEMIDVLVAAGGDRTRPGWKDVADLVWGAFRLHLRRMVAGGVEPRDVLAIVSLLGPIAVLAGATESLHELAWWVQAGALGGMPVWQQTPDAPMWVVWLAVAVLVVCRQRVAAAVGAWAGTIGLVLVATVSERSWSWAYADSGWVLLGALTAVALTLSPGPVRGRELAGRAPVLVLGAAVVVAVAIGVLGYRETVAEAACLVVLVVGAVVAAGAGSRAGRRAALVLLVPVMTTMIEALLATIDAFRPNDTVTALLFYGPPLVVLLALGGLLPRGVARRPDEPLT
ncbi:hypothetical protein [Actinophytocola algeriensis]|uniref:LigA protein n=1 Tax=Actinophytocola algeriensis TaxID=1768010 RepID=A0A7W7Q6U5_9PSEU|nr:hypothetical protein [Actinophytocola algeriensis]MBB4907736.1 hypothetical protein [Actinophytocola algeriensis]MBE1479766.1 hypothetical protein [Actinophytocola algeriensis]